MYSHIILIIDKLYNVQGAAKITRVITVVGDVATVSVSFSSLHEYVTSHVT